MNLLSQICVVLVIVLMVIKWYISLKVSAKEQAVQGQLLWAVLLVALDCIFCMLVIGVSALLLNPSDSFGGGSVGAFFFTLIGAPLLLASGAIGLLLSILTLKVRWWIASLSYVLPVVFIISFLIFSFFQEGLQRQENKEALIAQIMTPSLTQFVCANNEASLSVSDNKEVRIEWLEGKYNGWALAGHLDEDEKIFIWDSEFDLSTGGRYVSVMRKALQSCKNSEGKSLLEMYTEVPYSEPSTTL